MFLGALSYSLYLWQQPFINPTGGARVNAFPLNLGLALVCALASYYLVEQPMLRLRARLEPPRGRPGDPIVETLDLTQATPPVASADDATPLAGSRDPARKTVS